MEQIALPILPHSQLDSLSCPGRISLRRGPGGSRGVPFGLGGGRLEHVKVRMEERSACP